jgi:dTDP-4-dehydrorhamnose reductase
MKKIVIIGKGYIGNYLSKYLIKNPYFNIIHISKKDVDYTNPKIFEKFISEIGNKEFVSHVINCSGYTGTPNVDSCEDHKEECFKYNVTVPLYITKVCNRLNIPIIHIGSGCIYSGYDKIYEENDPTNFGVDAYNSSFYSKTKDSFEKLSARMNRYIFRIRIPFNSVAEPKNYLYKLLNYDSLISKQNSLTCVDDLLVFIKNFLLAETTIPHGIYNVVNRGSIDASTIVDMLKEEGLVNDNWKFVSVKDMNFRVERSNCILSTKKIEDIFLPMPDVNHSIIKCIKNYKVS